MFSFPRAAAPIAAVAFAACALNAAAHTESARSLPRAVDAAWLRTQAQAESQAAALRAEASRDVASSWLPAAPAVEISHRNGRWAPGSATDRETELAAALPLWQAGQRRTRQALAQADADLADTLRQHARWQLAGQVREAGWAVIAARAEHAQALAHRDNLQRVTADVARRVQAGDLARSDALAAQAEQLAAEASASESRLRMAEAERRWVLLTGLASPEAEQLAEQSVEPPPPAADTPELRLAERSVEQARRQADDVSTTRRDPAELLLSYRQESDAGAANRNSVGIGLRIPLGNDARNRPLDAQASGARLVAERQLAGVRARIDGDQAQARDAVQTAEARLRADRARQALVAERAALIRKAFHAGDMGLPELLRALSAASSAQVDVDRGQAVLGLARARLAQAQGITP